MRYRVKEVRGSVLIKIDGKGREDEVTRARQALSALLGRPGVKVILYLAGLREIGVPEIGVLEAIRREVKTQGGTLRLCALRENLRAQFDRNPFLQVYELYHSLEAGLSGLQELPLKRSA